MTCRQPVPPTESSLAETLAMRARSSPDHRVFVFLEDGVTESDSLTHEQLHRRAIDVAVQLRRSVRTGDRVLLVFQPGLDFITALCGCFYAGVIAVPCSPPRLELLAAGAEPLAGIARDCEPSLALFGSGMQRTLDACRVLPELERAECLLLERIPSARDSLLPPFMPHRDDLAIIQYTSGSTGDPKGVVLSHGNLLANEFVIQQAFGHVDSPRSGVGVCWLPFYHDMGLIGNVLQTIYLDACCYLMSPLMILQRPARWLQAIDAFDAHTSGGPNFAYDLCVQRITEEQKATLDLSRWDVAYIGAEVVSAETLDRFTEAFAPCGFRREAFYPCYGLAEATLMVTGGQELAGPILATGAAGTRDTDDPIRLVGCGHVRPDHELLIVDPDTHEPLPNGAVGEVWFRGPSKARGYWNRPQESEETFEARLADAGEGGFLRTGDLGFLERGELFITGRLKDLIVIRGTNHYPHDIEDTIVRLHEAFRPRSTAAIGCLLEGEERLVVLQEIDRQTRRLDAAALEAEIRNRVAKRHGVQAHEVVFVRNGSLPRTSSGKIRRNECRRRYLDRALTPWEATATT